MDERLQTGNTPEKLTEDERFLLLQLAEEKLESAAKKIVAVNPGLAEDAAFAILTTLADEASEMEDFKTDTPWSKLTEHEKWLITTMWGEFAHNPTEDTDPWWNN